MGVSLLTGQGAGRFVRGGLWSEATEMKVHAHINRRTGCGSHSQRQLSAVFFQQTLLFDRRQDRRQDRQSQFTVTAALSSPSAPAVPPRACGGTFTHSPADNRRETRLERADSEPCEAGRGKPESRERVGAESRERSAAPTS